MAVARRKKSQLDQVDRAIVAVERAVGRLVALLGDDDPAVLERAALALEQIGPFAVGPLASGLKTAATSRHRIVILGALLTFGRQARVPVMDALIAALKREPDPHVRAAAQAALDFLLVDDLRQVFTAAPGIRTARGKQS